MVRKEQKARMSEFIAEQLDGSGLYNILEREDSRILIAERSDVFEAPRTIDVLAHNYHMPLWVLRRTLRDNRGQGMPTAHIFYKDDETFMVRLGARGHLKGDDRSLKRYNKQQRDAMIHLRGLEKAVLGSPGELDYYQPETERLEEGVRVFEMRDVMLDYSHIQRGDAGFGFVRNSVSLDYKLPIEIATATGPIAIEHNQNFGNARIRPVTPVKFVQAAMF